MQSIKRFLRVYKSISVYDHMVELVKEWGKNETNFGGR